MNKDTILREIRRTAAENGGVPVGSRKFAQLTDIRPADWSGKLWARWGDALQEAGFAPNELTGAYSTAHLLEKMARLARELERIPTANDLRLRGRADKSYPNAKVFERLGSKIELVGQLLAFCEATPEFADVAGLCKGYVPGVSNRWWTAVPPKWSGMSIYFDMARVGSSRSAGRTIPFVVRGRSQFEVTIPDPAHSEGEARFLSLGLSATDRVLVVAYTEREGRIRIIHARVAEPKERRAYESDEASRT